MREAETYLPAQVADAFGLKPVTLRSWHALGLHTDADDALGDDPGKRRYTFADAVGIGMIARLAGADGTDYAPLRVSDAIKLHNAIRDHIKRAIASRDADHTAQPLVAADVAPGTPTGWRVHYFATPADFASVLAAIEPAFVGGEPTPVRLPFHIHVLSLSLFITVALLGLDRHHEEGSFVRGGL